MFENYPDLMNPEEAKAALGIGRSMMYRLLKAGSIRHMRVGKVIRIPKRYLLDYIEEGCYSGDAAAGKEGCYSEGNPVLPLKGAKQNDREFADFA